MNRLSTTKARENFAETLNLAAFRGKRIRLQRRGKDVAALIPVEDLELLEAIENRLDVKAARKALREAKRSGTVAWTKIRADLNL